jgi:hypothetical protein
MAINLDQFHRDLGAGEEIFSGCVLPAQYNAGPKGHRAWENERRLLAAVLEDAIRCYLTNCGGKTKTQLDRFWEVQAWFNDHRPARRPYGLFSFEAICEALDIEPGLLRQRLSSIPAARVRGRSHRYPGPRPRVIRRDRQRAAGAER